MGKAKASGTKKIKRIGKKKASRKKISGSREVWLAERADYILRQLRRAKALYGELDRITTELRSYGFDRNDRIYLVDNFESGNTSWKSTAICRFELKLKK